MKYLVTLNNKKYEVEVEQNQATILGAEKYTSKYILADAIPSSNAVSNIQEAPKVAPVQESKATTPKSLVVEDNGSGETIKSPMPGVILNVKVNSGTKVKKGEVLLILEAMKMENEIVAPIDGVIVSVNVSKGSAVNTGDVLTIIQ